MSHEAIQKNKSGTFFMDQRVHCVSKNIPDIFDCNFKKSYQILIISCANISDTTCHQITIQFLTSLNVCICITKGIQSKRNMCWNTQEREKKHPRHYRS